MNKSNNRFKQMRFVQLFERGHSQYICFCVRCIFLENNGDENRDKRWKRKRGGEKKQMLRIASHPRMTCTACALSALFIHESMINESQTTRKYRLLNTTTKITTNWKKKTRPATHSTHTQQQTVEIMIIITISLDRELILLDFECVCVFFETHNRFQTRCCWCCCFFFVGYFYRQYFF